MTEIEGIPFWMHKQLVSRAIKAFGTRWSVNHDRWITAQLFQQGWITDQQRSEQTEKMDSLVRAARERDPNYGRWRVW